MLRDLPVLDQFSAKMEKQLYRGILDNDMNAITEMLKCVSVDKAVDIDLVDELVQAGNVKNIHLLDIPRVAHLSPLHLACVCGHTDVAKLLLDRGADTEAKLDDEETPIHFACLYGQVECAKVLIAYHCNVDAQTRGDTPLMLTVACYGTRDASLKQRYFEIAKILIDAGCDVNIGDTQGLTPIHLAAGKEDPNLLKLLIQAGADVNSKSMNLPKTPLLCAVYAALEENVNLLLSAGCNVNDVAFPGVTALSAAVDNETMGIVLDLLRAGANPQIRTDTVPVNTYLSNKQYVMVLLLLAYGLDVNWQSPYDKASILVTVSRSGSLAMAKCLLQLGADPDLDTRLGTTPLWAAVKHDNERLVRTLLRWNCDLNTSSLEYNPLIPISPIQLALINGNKNITRQLLYFGSRLKVRWLLNEPVSSRLKEREHLQLWLYDYISKPFSLCHLCMLQIRSSLGPALPRKARQLSLPAQMKKYIIHGEL